MYISRVLIEERNGAAAATNRCLRDARRVMERKGSIMCKICRAGSSRSRPIQEVVDTDKQYIHYIHQTVTI